MLPLLLGFPSATVSPSDPWLAPLRAGRVAGVILFANSPAGETRNIESPAQTRRLIRDLKALSPHPLLVAIDQEGGHVQRLRAPQGFLETPSARDLGRAPDRAEAAYAQLAQQLAELGFNFNLAPVVDLDLEPDNAIIGGKARSFSADPETVIALARTCLAAHRACGVATCLKHFPGHGSSRGDTHLGLVDVSEPWQEIELRPYQALAKEAPAVLTAHVIQRHLDPQWPISLSSTVIGDLLRGQLAFQGTVVTDDLQMGAITGHYGYEEAIVRSLVAGNDLLIVGNNLTPDPEAVPRAEMAVQEALQKGLLTQGRLTDAHNRLTTLLSSVT